MSEFFEVGIERVPLLIDRIINESKQITKENIGTVELFQDIKNMDSFYDCIWFYNIFTYLSKGGHKSPLRIIVSKIANNDKQLANKFINTLRHEVNDDFISWIFLYPAPIPPKFKQIVDEHLEKNYPELIKKEENNEKDLHI